MDEKLYKSRTGRIELILRILCFLGFAAAAIFAGVHIAGDSEAYMTMRNDLKPGYPMFLWLLRTICGGKDIYLQVACILQNLLAALGITFLAEKMKLLYGLHGIQQLPVYLFSVAACFGSGLFSRTRFLVLNGIMTEGLAIPLFFFFFGLLLEAWLTKREAALLLSMVFAALLCLIRGQFLFLFPVLFLILLICSYKKTFHVPVFCRGILVLVLLFAAVVSLGRLYVYGVSGSTASTSPGSKAVASHVLMVADEADADLLEPEQREPYLAMLDRFREKGWHADAMPSSLIDRALAIEDVHDRACRHMNKITGQTMKERGIADSTEIRAFQSTCYTAVIKKVLPRHLAAWLYNYLALAVVGMIRTVAVPGGIFRWVAAALYLIALVLMIVLFVRDKESRGAKGMVLVLGLAIANVCAMSGLIMCLSRYTIYLLPMFYAMLYVMVREVVKVKPKRW